MGANRHSSCKFGSDKSYSQHFEEKKLHTLNSRNATCSTEGTDELHKIRLVCVSQRSDVRVEGKAGQGVDQLCLLIVRQLLE